MVMTIVEEEVMTIVEELETMTVAEEVTMTVAEVETMTVEDQIDAAVIMIVNEANTDETEEIFLDMLRS